MFDWYELNLVRKPPAFLFAHRLVKAVAFIGGLGASILALMAIVSLYVRPLAVHAVAAVVLALGVPALVARILRPKEEVIALGHTSDTYALVLLAFAVFAVVYEHDRMAPALAREGDRLSAAGFRPVAEAEWFLARVAPR